jgi:hypothetical protein
MVPVLVVLFGVVAQKSWRRSHLPRLPRQIASTFLWTLVPTCRWKRALRAVGPFRRRLAILVCVI